MTVPLHVDRFLKLQIFGIQYNKFWIDMNLMKLVRTELGGCYTPRLDRTPSSICIILVSYHTKPGATKQFCQHPWTDIFDFFLSLTQNRLYFWELKIARRRRGKKPIFSLVPIKSLVPCPVWGNSDKRHDLKTVTQDTRNGEKRHKVGLKFRQQQRKSQIQQ